MCPLGPNIYIAIVGFLFGLYVVMLSVILCQCNNIELTWHGTLLAWFTVNICAALLLHHVMVEACEANLAVCSRCDLNHFGRLAPVINFEVMRFVQLRWWRTAVQHVLQLYCKCCIKQAIAIWYASFQEWATRPKLQHFGHILDWAITSWGRWDGDICRFDSVLQMSFPHLVRKTCKQY